MARGVDGLNECKGLKNGLPRGVAGGRPAPGDAAPTMWLDPRAFGTSPTRRKSPVTHRNVEGTGFLAGPQKVAPWTGSFPSGPGHGWAGVGNASETQCMSEMAVERSSVGEIGPRRHGRLEGIVPRKALVASTGTLGHGRIGPWQPEDPGLGPAGHWPHRAYRPACAACRVGSWLRSTRWHTGWDGTHGGPPLRHRAGSPSPRPRLRARTSDWPWWMAKGAMGGDRLLARQRAFRAVLGSWLIVLTPKAGKSRGLVGRFLGRPGDQGLGIFEARRSTLACMSGSQRSERMPSKVLRAASQSCEAT